MSNYPLWFNENEYSDFLNESFFLLEFNLPLQKEKVDSRKKLREFDRQMAIRRINLKRENMRDEAQAKARGIQMGLGEGFIKEKLQTAFLDKLAEERTPVKAEKRKMRPEVDPADRERDRKREERRQDSQESELKRIIIVKNSRRNKIEIIPKDDYNPETHTVLKGKVKKIDKGNITPRDLRHYSQMENFINTKTSVRLLGKIEKEQEKETEASSTPTEIPPPRIRVPVDGKEITDPASSYPDWDHDTSQMVYGLPYVLGSINGQEIPDELSGLLSYSRTLNDSLQRLMQEILSQYPELTEMKIEQNEPVIKTGKVWSKNGIKEAAPTSLFTGTLGKEKTGISIKIGEQVTLLPKQEAQITVVSTISQMEENVVYPVFNSLFEDFVQNLRMGNIELPYPQRAFSDKQGIASLEKERWKKETLKIQKNRLVYKSQKLVEDFINIPEIKAQIIKEALTGELKFDKKIGSAQLLISANKDGSDAAITPLSAEFFEEFTKSKDTDLILTFNQTDNEFTTSLMNMLVPLNESFMDVVSELQKNKQNLSNPLEFLQALGLTVTNISFVKPILYSNFIKQNTNSYNTITLNINTDREEEINIPVKRNYNPQGKEESVIEKGIDSILNEYLLANDYLVDQIKQGNINLLDSLLFLEEEFNVLEGRNYRKEYDNYHSKPKQRANRSKRVLARRKMEDKGKVSKGDGKDVHHKDGNPQNNGDGNLTVMNKSKNRSMNEEHGAGFEGTDQLLQNLIDQTPLAHNPVKTKLSKYLEDRYVKKIKKK